MNNRTKNTDFFIFPSEFLRTSLLPHLTLQSFNESSHLQKLLQLEPLWEKRKLLINWAKIQKTNFYRCDFIFLTS